MKPIAINKMSDNFLREVYVAIGMANGVWKSSTDKSGEIIFTTDIKIATNDNNEFLFDGKIYTIYYRMFKEIWTVGMEKGDMCEVFGCWNSEKGRYYRVRCVHSPARTRIHRIENIINS